MATAKPNLDTIVCTAVEIASADGRAAYVARACGADAELRARVDKLVAAHFAAGDFLQSAAPVAPPSALTEDPVAERPGTMIGPYKLLQQIGEGGFGVVYMAEQTEPVRRKVALKILKPGMDTKQVVARFEAERQALAIMDHPNIAKVFDGGMTAGKDEGGRMKDESDVGSDSSFRLPPSSFSAGRPFFVMELVKGVPITEFCDEQKLSPRQRLELFLPVCHAVQHAHQKGIIHRDLKPSNILVVMHDTTPVPKVIDFGVAKALGQELTDKTLFTGFAQMVGTPLYMSPEQAGQSGLDIDTRSDIYSLGVLLYELLTGTTPFDRERFKKAAYDEIRRIIREEEPPKPSTRLSELGSRHAPCVVPDGTRSAPATSSLASISAQRQTEPVKLAKLVRGELDWIVMKALEKDRNRRYETANGLAMDVQRYLADEPVLACPPSAGYRLRKFIWRNKGPVLAASIIFLVLVAGIGGTSFGLIQARLAEQEAVEAQKREAQRAEGESQAKQKALAATEAEKQAHRVARFQLYQAKFSQAKASRWSGRVGQRFESLKALTEAAQLARELGLDEGHLLALRNEAIACMALVDLRMVNVRFPGPGFIWAFNDQLERYAVTDPFNHQVGNVIQGQIVVRTVADNREISRFPAAGIDPWFLIFSPNGRYLAGRLVGKSLTRDLLVWDVDRGEIILQIPQGVHADAVAFSADSRLLAAVRKDGSVHVYDVATRKEVKKLAGDMTPVSIAFDPTGRMVAVSLETDHRVHLRELDTGKLLAALAHPGKPWRMAWHPDGTLLAVAGVDTNVYLWNIKKPDRPQAVLAGAEKEVTYVRFNHRGDLLASSSWDGTTRLWDPSTGKQLVRIHGNGAMGFCWFSPDDSKMAIRGGELWEVANWREFRPLQDRDYVDLGSAGKGLVSATPEGMRVWYPTIWDGAEHLDGKSLITAGATGLQRWPITWEPPPGADRNDGPTVLRVGSPEGIGGSPRASLTLNGISLSLDGRTVAAIHTGAQRAVVFDLQEPSRKIELGFHRGLFGLATTTVGPDGKWVATGNWHGSGVKIWDARTGKLEKDLTVGINSNAIFSPDGKWLVTGSDSGYRLLHVGTWQITHRIGREGGNDFIGFMAFAPDGQPLAITPSRNTVRLVKPDSGEELATLESPLPREIHSLKFSPDGSQLAAAWEWVHLWDLRLIRQRLAEMGLDWELPAYPPPKYTPPRPLQVKVAKGGC